jgi:hypothetical protein
MKQVINKNFPTNRWYATVDAALWDADIESRFGSYILDIHSPFHDSKNRNVSLSFELRIDGTSCSVGVRNCEWETYFAHFESESVETAKEKATQYVQEFLTSLLAALAREIYDEKMGKLSNKRQ